MRPTAAQHPSVSELASFALGKPDPATVEWVSEHLARCPDCRSVVERTPHDSLVRLLRQAHAAATPPPGGATPSIQGFTTRGPVPAPPLDQADLPPALRDHPRYRILRQLGQGGMGTVYQAEHKVMERLVAVKVISRSLLDHPEAAERFHREIRAAASLDHPNIVKAYDAEQAGDLQLLAMEYVEGRSLADVLAKKGPLPVAHACHYIRQAALGLQHAHEKGMVHRDLKPHNLMLTSRGVVKILDFGLAKLARERQSRGGLTQDNAVLGTPAYMAPEQAQKTKAADIRADIYSLGCTLFHLLTGREPFPGDDALNIIVAHLQDPPPPLESLRPDVPPGLAALVARMLAKDPDQRPQTPKEVAEALAPYGKAGAGRAEPDKSVSGKSAMRKSPASWGTSNATSARIKESPFEALEEGPASHPSAKRPTRWLVPVVGAASVLLAVSVLAGVLLTIKTKDGVVTLQVDPPDAEVTVEEGRITVSRKGESDSYTITVAEGGGKLRITRAGFEVQTREVSLREKGRTLTVTLKPKDVSKPADQPLAAAPANAKSPALPSVPERVRSVDGFVPLFNGKDLTGWKTAPGNEGYWVVAQGVLIGSNPGTGGFSLIFSERDDFTDFHLRAEARCSDGNYSQMILRTLDPPRITRGYRIVINSNNSNSLKTGSLEGLATVRMPPVRANEWFTLDAIAQGNHIVIKVNRRTTADCTDTQIRLNRGKITMIANQIGRVEFRKIEIKELSAPDPAAAPLPLGKSPESPKRPEVPSIARVTPRDGGFVPLFNGRDFTGWRVFLNPPADDVDPHDVYSIKDGVIHCSGKVAGYLRTEKEYSDYVLRFQWRSPEASSNSSVLVHTTGPDMIVPKAVRATPSGQFHLVGGFRLTIPNAAGRQHPRFSSVYAPIGGHWEARAEKDKSGRPLYSAVFKPVEKPPGEWNQGEIICREDTIKYIINGQLVNEGTRAELTKGSVLLVQFRVVNFQSDGQTIIRGPTEFRNIEIKELSAK